jgi:hypothetical protein
LSVLVSGPFKPNFPCPEHRISLITTTTTPTA